MNQKIKDKRNTTIQQTTDTWNRLAPNHAATIPITSAIAPEIGELVVSMIAGKVITANVTYGT